MASVGVDLCFYELPWVRLASLLIGGPRFCLERSDSTVITVCGAGMQRSVRAVCCLRMPRARRQGGSDCGGRTMGLPPASCRCAARGDRRGTPASHSPRLPPLFWLFFSKLDVLTRLAFGRHRVGRKSCSSHHLALASVRIGMELQVWMPASGCRPDKSVVGRRRLFHPPWHRLPVKIVLYVAWRRPRG